ncbi:hypothetical protein [Cognatilysobacter tabacisoli]|uniref:hypothetical protein n=1 Tax=Cognatilysobacter tabacisoli TaxID=2315424 RepID=UPI001300406A|nr:hypothetical protein [Lysobacter tabacisoli]
MATARPLLVIALALAAGWAGCAHAFTVDITPRNPRTLYLRVGDGAFSGGNFDSGGQPGTLGTVNTVSVTVPAGQIGSGTALAMSGNASQLISNYDGFAFCAAGQIYVGGFYRRNGQGGSASLTVAAPSALTSGSNDPIPFSQISWTSSGIGDTGAQPIPGGTFTGGAQALATFPANSWRESCLSFRYANTLVRPAGVYRGTVTYTLTAP